MAEPLKIRIPNSLIIVNLLTVLLVAAVFIIRWTPLRFALGLPLLLFFPGYALFRILFVNIKEIGVLEAIGISGAMSVAVTAMTGFALNYTELGVRLDPVVGFITAFIFAASVIALLRQNALPGGLKWWNDFDINRLAPQIPADKKRGYLGLCVIMLVALAASFFAASYFKSAETFTEFYILGLDGKAENYPSSFLIQSGKVASVNYTGGAVTVGQWGKVYLNVINRESSIKNYSIQLLIDNRPADLMYGNATHRSYDIRLNNNGRWSDEMGFSPAYSGRDQKVDFLLYADGRQDPEATLTLWINVEEQP